MPIYELILLAELKFAGVTDMGEGLIISCGNVGAYTEFWNERLNADKLAGSSEGVRVLYT